MSIQLVTPLPVFADIDGDPLEAGSIFIGVVDLDPESNPISVYWDAGLTSIATQPIMTKGGFPQNTGVSGRLFTSTPYSIRVKNRNGSIVSSVTNAVDFITDATVDTIADLRAFPTPAYSGFPISVKGYYAIGDGGGGPIRYFALGAAPGTYVDNWGSIIVPTGGDGSAAWLFDLPETIDIRWFGIQSSSTVDQGSQLDTILSVAGSNRRVFNPGLLRVTNRTFAQDNIEFFGGTVYCDLFKVSGDNWHIHDTVFAIDSSATIHTNYSTYNGLGGVWFSGSDNLVERVEAYRVSYTYDSNVQSMPNVLFGANYDIGDFISQAAPPTGHRNKLYDSYVHTSEQGIFLAGKGNIISRNHFEATSTTVRLSASSRDCLISENNFDTPQPDYFSGADQILASRNVGRIRIVNNNFTGAGEHSIYFQGWNSVISGNTFNGSSASGIKIAAYNDFLYWYGDETPTLLHPSGGFCGFGNVISNNTFINMVQGVGNDNTACIYLQAGSGVQLTGLVDILVEGNNIQGSLGYGIRSVFIDSSAYVANYEILNNIVRDTVNPSISIAGQVGGKICGNTCDGNINTYAMDGSDFEEALIDGNSSPEISISRTRNSIVSNNVVGNVAGNSNGTSNTLRGNRITDQTSTLDQCFAVIEDNRIISTQTTMLYDVSGSPSSIAPSFCRNRITNDTVSSSYYLKTSTTVSTLVERGRFCDNIIITGACNRPVSWSGTDMVISGNTISHATASSPISIDYFGSRSVLNCNAVQSSINLRGDDNLASSNQCTSVSLTGTGNTAVNNI